MMEASTPSLKADQSRGLPSQGLKSKAEAGEVVAGGGGGLGRLMTNCLISPSWERMPELSSPTHATMPVKSRVNLWTRLKIFVSCRKMKLLNRGALGFKKGYVPLQLWLPSLRTHHIGYIQDVYVIQEVPWYWYSTNESIYHPGTLKIWQWNC